MLSNGLGPESVLFAYFGDSFLLLRSREEILLAVTVFGGTEEFASVPNLSKQVPCFTNRM
jgi:hypothetical protein